MPKTKTFTATVELLARGLYSDACGETEDPGSWATWQQMTKAARTRWRVDALELIEEAHNG